MVGFLIIGYFLAYGVYTILGVTPLNMLKKTHVTQNFIMDSVNDCRPVIVKSCVGYCTVVQNSCFFLSLCHDVPPTIYGSVTTAD